MRGKLLTSIRWLNNTGDASLKKVMWKHRNIEKQQAFMTVVSEKVYLQVWTILNEIIFFYIM